jgi:hypothetical protein
MNARVKTKDRLSKRELNELTELAVQEYQKRMDQYGEDVVRRVIKLFCQAMYETRKWGTNGFLPVVRKVIELDKQCDDNPELMSHIEQNLKRVGYDFEDEDPEKWVMQ